MSETVEPTQPTSPTTDLTDLTYHRSLARRFQLTDKWGWGAFRSCSELYTSSLVGEMGLRLVRRTGPPPPSPVPAPPPPPPPLGKLKIPPSPGWTVELGVGLRSVESATK